MDNLLDIEAVDEVEVDIENESEVDVEVEKVGPAGKDGKSAYEIYVDNGGILSEVEWLDSLKGRDGIDGHDGIDGTDGISPIATIIKTEEGATITIKDSTGTTTVNLFNGQDGKQGEQGDKGDDGANGVDGYTPVKGTDYWTESDIAEIKNYCDSYINSQLGTINTELASLTTVSEVE